ncbi:MAG: FAD-binding oxidoreductase [Pseudomonadota bacterium]
MTRITVVGAGIVGAAIAYRLAEAGAEVTLIDKGGPGVGASGKSFAWINANDPEPAFYNHFRQEALAAWRRLDDALDLPIRWKGCLAWDQGDNALRAQADALAALGRDACMIGREEIAALAPALADPPDSALWSPDEGAADAAGVARALGAAAAASGAVRLMGAEVHGFLRDGDRLTGLETSFGAVEADRIVLAAGLGTVPLAAMAGVEVPVEPVTGLLIRTRPVQRMIEPIILSRTVHFHQEPDGRIVAAEEFSGAAASPDEMRRDPRAVAEAVLDGLRALLPGIALELDEVVLGTRPAPADGLPIIGPAAEGLYLAVMHSGVTLAALVGELAAKEVIGEKQDQLAAFRLERFVKQS